MLFLLRRRLSTMTAASSRPLGVGVPPKIEAILRGAYGELDPAAPSMLDKLHDSSAPLIWHKHGSFLDHLRDVWVMLCAWEQPQSWCRLGLFHSAYSNSFVSMNLYDATKDRSNLASLVGPEAETLVYKFCVINRQQLEDEVEAELTIRDTTSTHIHTGERVELSSVEAAACVAETIADQMDQSLSWQSDLEAGHTASLWPGLYMPTLRMSKLSKFANALRNGGVVPADTLPPIFDSCSTLLDAQNERQARDLYWRVVGRPGDVKVADDDDVATLCDASALNPFVAEPHVVRAQILLQMGRFEEAEHAARKGLDIFCDWATQWDKRMPFVAWVAWTRCLVFQAQLREWPTTHGGLESLGAVDPSMRFRPLNKDRLG
ncbi:hypothetical protein CTAYLR_003245 [Chrysophaeum taylorii]|uniref:DUF6817 domain-containing protein n=1 Tax=Chrysophaeum taylorii TaxID=2483200 RepID=A0AAD7XK12_9STRA|nr:hypothetical protein CTAYLR_003245 [Chrysophaeum taylorii]